VVGEENAFRVTLNSSVLAEAANTLQKSSNIIPMLCDEFLSFIPVIFDNNQC
jgi:hypothetical protein